MVASMRKDFASAGPVEVSYADYISPIEEIIEDAKIGKMYILVDHESRENEGDLIIPAEFASAHAINFMATHGRGLICLTLTEERVSTLGLGMMTSRNSSRQETAFTVSIEAREGITTGISAADRATTISAAIDPSKNAFDIVTPGHVFPLKARKGGVLVRAGHTEAGCDISRLAGLSPYSVICEIMNPDGTMARLPDLIEFANKHDLKIGTIADLIRYRNMNDNLVIETSKQMVRSHFGGEWELRIFTDQVYGIDHAIMTKGDITTHEPLLIRAHSQNDMSDLLGLGSARAHELSTAMEIIAQEGRGAVCLFREPKPTLYSPETEEPEIVKHTGLGAQMLSSLGASKLILLSNAPRKKYLGLDFYGLEIVGTRPIKL